MNTSEIRTLYDYNYWANDRILNAAAGAPPRVIMEIICLTLD
jgi:hypothetical protein